MQENAEDVDPDLEASNPFLGLEEGFGELGGGGRLWVGGAHGGGD